MKIAIEHHGNRYNADLDQPIDLSIELGKVRCFYAPEVKLQPFTDGDFIGSVASGAPVNYYNVAINPHGNGTHTECLGHITKEHEQLSDCYTGRTHFIAELKSVALDNLENGDQVITAELLGEINPQSEALIIRTMPNSLAKLSKDYTETNPPYFTADAMQAIVNAKIVHLLVDLPSVDREVDAGALANHNMFWGTTGEQRRHCTITELIFVPSEVDDNLYLLDLQVSPIGLDAVPSKPVIYKLEKTKI